MKDNIQAKFYSVLHKVLRINESEISDSLTPDDIEFWDSLSGMQLISELENEFKVRFEMEEVFDIFSIGDIRKLLDEKIGK